MSKEQLEKSKLLADMIKKETRLPHNFPFELIDWLIEQAEQNKRYRELIKKLKRMVYDPDVDCGMICTEIIEMEESE